MRPSNPTLKFSDEEFKAKSRDDMIPNSATSAKKAATFIQLFGTSKWNKLKSQFAKQRIPPENPAGFSSEEIKNMSDEEYAKHRQKIKDAEALPDKDEPVYGEVEAPDLSLKGLEGQKMFINSFGYERYFQAMDVNVNLDSKAYHEALGRDYKPYKTHVTASAKKKTG